MEQTNDLVIVINQSGLDTSKSESLMKSFAGYFTEAKEIAEKSKSIIVTDESQVDEMKKAREYRLKLKDIRVNADKTRAELKEQSLREGNAIQGVYNIIKALVVPVEEYLEKQEKFAEIKEQLRLEKQLNERVEKLSQYVNDVSLYSLKDMADEVFENLLAGCKANFEKAQQEQKEAQEKERIENEKRNTLRNRQNQLAPYSLFIKEKIDLDTTVDEFNKIYLKAIDDKKKYDLDQEAIRKQNEQLQKKIDDERKAKEQAEENLRKEKEAQAQKEADEKAKAEADKKAQEEIERQRLLAPDKEKILDFAIQLSKIEAPAVKSNEANQILSEALKIIITAVDTLQNGAKKL